MKLKRHVLFEEIRECYEVAMMCETYGSAMISMHEARGMVQLAFMTDMLNTHQYNTMRQLIRNLSNEIVKKYL